MFCSQCGANNADTAAVCVQCGRNLQAATGLPQPFLRGVWIRALCAAIILFGIARNLPLYPFDLLAPGAMLHLSGRCSPATQLFHSVMRSRAGCGFSCGSLRRLHKFETCVGW